MAANGSNIISYPPEEHQDFTVVHGPRVYRVHRVMLARRSPVFSRMLKPDSPFLEARTGELLLSIDEHHWASVIWMMMAIYGDRRGVREGLFLAVQSPERIPTIAGVIGLFDKYQMESLMTDLLMEIDACADMLRQYANELVFLFVNNEEFRECNKRLQWLAFKLLKGQWRNGLILRPETIRYMVNQLPVEASQFLSEALSWGRT